MKTIDEWLQDLKHTDAEIRLQAVEALREINDPKAATALEKCLDDVHDGVRSSAAIGLGWQAHRPAIAKLIEMLCELPKPEWEVDVNPASSACFALALIGEYEPVAMLLHDKNEHIRSLAIVTLRYIGDKRILPQIKAIARQDSVQWVRDEAQETLQAFAAKDFRPLRDTL